MYRLVLTILVGTAIAAPFIMGQAFWFVEEQVTTDERLFRAYERGWRDATENCARAHPNGQIDEVAPPLAL